MGKSETASVSIGINIRIKDVLDAMDEDNYKEIRNYLFTDDAFIQDSNGVYTDTYLGIIGGYNPETNKYVNIKKLEYKKYKEYLSDLFKEYGDRTDKNDYVYYEEDDLENLYHSNLLVPHFSLVETERWGHHREGTNGNSSDLDIPQLTQLTKDIHETMKEMKIVKDDYDISLIVMQNSG